MNAVIVTGVQQLDRKLASMPVSMQKKAVRTATRESAKKVLEDARRLAPKQTGRLRRSLTVRTARTGFRHRKLPRGTLGHEVTTKEGHLFKGKAFYGGILEFGTKKTDRIAAVRYLRNALYDNTEAVRAVFVGSLNKFVTSQKDHG